MISRYIVLSTYYEYVNLINQLLLVELHLEALAAAYTNSQRARNLPARDATEVKLPRGSE